MPVTAEQTMLKGLLDNNPFVVSEQATLSRLQLFQQAIALSQTFSSQAQVINLAENRDEFISILLATALVGGTTILPPNTAPNTLKELHKMLSEADSEKEIISLSSLEVMSSLKLEQPMAETTAVLTGLTETILNAPIWLYTSGSTGSPKCVIKTWRAMMVLAQKAINRFQLTGKSLENPSLLMVGTVPCQHMFGLETMVFWPLFSEALLWKNRPLFPEDIASALACSASVSAQPLLVSTPLHLNTLVQYNLTWPEQKLSILSATAPLSQALAKQLKQRLNARVFEVFGSTEMASIASRETLVSEEWHLYQNTLVVAPSETGYCEIHIQELSERHLLQDRIHWLGANRFTLLGRQTDLIKVAGKRGSLSHLNNLISAIKEVKEGVFIQPKDQERLAAFVVSSLTPKEIKEALKNSIDAVFLPRPLIFIKALPRNEVGKVQIATLLDCLEKRKL